MKTLLTVQDPYNSIKTWIVQKTKCGHYYLTQKVKGVQTGKSRMSLKHIRQTLDFAEV